MRVIDHTIVVMFVMKLFESKQPITLTKLSCTFLRKLNDAFHSLFSRFGEEKFLQ